MPTLTPTPRRRPVRRAKRPAKPTGAPRRAPSEGKAKAAAALPSWTDLDAGSAAAIRAGGKGGALDRVPTRQFVLLVVLACVALTAYVSHTYATNKLAREAESLRLENERLHLRHDRLQTERDRRIGPAVILERAAVLGLVEGHAYAQPIQMTGGG